MSETVSTTLLNVLLVIVLAVAAILVAKRQREAHERRESEMRGAVDLLAVHAHSLAALDDDAMPPSLAAFALDVSDLLHDIDRRATMLSVARRRAFQRGRGLITPSQPSQADATLVADYLALRAVRPDLATAYMQSIVAGILSFERRYPECAGAFGVDVARLIDSPVDEAERVVREARSMREAWGPAPALAA
ncbi:hypothetical protein [Methylobacterium sp. J-067]|uniref:hypothetical protein n=1 Tax=Methylobacterium sp. J-067 TaxID=2836648 RepID=UPI001FB9CC01|nr:hypothetical protein [Methylobacterium sp. J-067]MCJ2023961.1 hypothetical protein [Methylobacterium sp. J-067]